eukprot:5524127-Prorocentrum_lima.AAC.1
MAGPHGGAIGLCGRDSRHFWSVPLIAHRLQAQRPDAHIHVLLENAASMRPQQRRTICAALGLPTPVSYTHLTLPTICSV